jgi:hypothetical protein
MLVWIKVVVLEPVQPIQQPWADRLKRQLACELGYYQHGQQPAWLVAHASSASKKIDTGA